jgi:hypothetical protein
MKSNFFVLLICFAFISCNDAKSKKTDGQTEEIETEVETTKLKTYVGEFIKVDDAAILKGKDFIYGVVLDSTGMELANQAESYKFDEYDMVPVVVTGDLIPNDEEEGWEEFIKVKQIIRLSEPRMEETIEIKKSIK